MKQPGYHVAPWRQGRKFESCHPDIKPANSGEAFLFMRVYILKSTKTGMYYCGQTADMENRLLLHNSGRNKSTAHGAPWELTPFPPEIFSSNDFKTFQAIF